MSRCALGVVRGRLTLMSKFAEYDEVRVQGVVTNVERWARDGRGQCGRGKEAFKHTEATRANLHLREIRSAMVISYLRASKAHRPQTLEVASYRRRATHNLSLEVVGALPRGVWRASSQVPCRFRPSHAQGDGKRK